MKLDLKIPELLPIHGQKIKIYYRGMKKTCNNCYEEGHLRKDCENEKNQWLTYVAKFMESNPKISQDLDGKWTRLLEDKIMKVQAEKPLTVACEFQRFHKNKKQKSE